MQHIATEEEEAQGAGFQGKTYVVFPHYLEPRK